MGFLDHGPPGAPEKRILLLGEHVIPEGTFAKVNVTLCAAHAQFRRDQGRNWRSRV